MDAARLEPTGRKKKRKECEMEGVNINTLYFIPLFSPLFSVILVSLQLVPLLIALLSGVLLNVS